MQELIVVVDVIWSAVFTAKQGIVVVIVFEFEVPAFVVVVVVILAVVYN